MRCRHHRLDDDIERAPADSHEDAEPPWCDCPVDHGTGRSCITVTVPTMSDRTDLRRVAARLHDLPGVVAVEIDLPTRTVRVDGVDDHRAVTDAIASAGYPVRTPAPR